MRRFGVGYNRCCSGGMGILYHYAVSMTGAGKWADFTVLDKDIMTIPENEIPTTKVIATFINGERVY